MNLIGEVEGRTCVLVDDIVDTAGTLCKAAEALKKNGANKVVAYATHAVLSGSAIENIPTRSLMNWWLPTVFRCVKRPLNVARSALFHSANCSVSRCVVSATKNLSAPCLTRTFDYSFGFANKHCCNRLISEALNLRFRSGRGLFWHNLETIMSTDLTLQAKGREDTGKGASRRLRRLAGEIQPSFTVVVRKNQHRLAWFTKM